MADDMDEREIREQILRIVRDWKDGRLTVRYSPRESLSEGSDVLITCDLVIVGTPELIATREISRPVDLVHRCGRNPWQSSVR